MQHLALITYAAAHRALPQAAAGGAADHYATVSEKSPPQLGLQPREKLGEFRRSVADHPRCLRFEYLAAHLNRTGQKQALVVELTHQGPPQVCE